MLLAGLVLCVTLGIADLLYLNLSVLPQIWSTGSSDRQTTHPGDKVARAPGEVEVKRISPSRSVPTPPPVPSAEQPLQVQVAASEVDSPVRPPSSSGSEQDRRKAASQEKIGETVLHYRPGRFQVTTAHKRDLERILGKASDLSRARVVVEGHADRTGSVDNKLLSQRRADMAAAFIQEQGVLKEHITSKGYGATRPMDKGNNPAAWAKNRRVEIRIFKGTP
ncbi:MAG: OmpA family protein [Desulfovibrionales bacterium]